MFSLPFSAFLVPGTATPRSATRARPATQPWWSCCWRRGRRRHCRRGRSPHIAHRILFRSEVVESGSSCVQNCSFDLFSVPFLVLSLPFLLFSVPFGAFSVPFRAFLCVSSAFLLCYHCLSVPAVARSAAANSPDAYGALPPPPGTPDPQNQINVQTKSAHSSLGALRVLMAPTWEFRAALHLKGPPLTPVQLSEHGRAAPPHSTLTRGGVGRRAAGAQGGRVLPAGGGSQPQSLCIIPAAAVG